MVTRSTLVGEADQRRRIFNLGETVYQCDVCKRRNRVPTNKYSVDVIQRCIITKNCLGKLHKILTTAEANDVSAITPSLPDTKDWVQRRVYYLHEQAIEDSVWIVRHGLANRPSVQVFVEQLVDGVEELVEVDPQEIRVEIIHTSLHPILSERKGWCNS